MTQVLLFDTVAGLVVLAIVMALSAYLRQLSVASQELSDKIQKKDNSAPFPWDLADDAIGQEWVEFEKRIQARVKFVMQALFLLMIAVSVRILGSAAKPIFDPSGLYNSKLFVCDLAICGFLTLLIITMWIAHTVSSWHHARIRNRAIASRKRNIS